MKKIFLFIILCSAVIISQQIQKLSPAVNETLTRTDKDNKVLIWIFFTDKGNQNERYYADPLLVVSEKSLKRRLKLNTGTAIDFTDLPLYNQYIESIRNAGFKLRQKSKWFNGISGYADKQTILQITKFPFVQKIDLVYGYKKDYSVQENENPSPLNKYLQPEGVLSYNYGISLTQLQQINVPAVHDLGYRGQGVTICVMDAGFNRLTHEAFDSMTIIAKWDFVNGDPNVGDEGDMGTGVHGTQTLSTIGGFKEGQLIGPAFDATYILAKTENTDSETPVEEDNWIAAMEWADSIGVDVTSTSLGYLFMDSGYPGYTWEDMDGNTAIITKGADLATHKGIVVVNSAGNEGGNGTPNTLSAPADGDSVIAVGAVSSSGTRVSFSGYGPTVDGRTKPDIMAMGSSVYVASPYNNTQYTYSSGTSFSCPLAAGVAALILCRNPNLTPMQVRDAMRLTASQSTAPDNYYGWGILNALNAINYFPTTFQLTVNTNTGWNMVSIPGHLPTNQNVASWWPGKDPAANVFKYNGAYQTVTVAEPTQGYWMKNMTNEVYNTGDEWPAGGILIVPHDSILVVQGWKMFGVYECPVPVNGITTTPPGIIQGQIYKFGSGYQPVDTLYPGYGYWANIVQGGVIHLPACSLNLGPMVNLNRGYDNFGRIIITDISGSSYTLYSAPEGTVLNNYNLPPLPPEGIFDIRYSTQRYAENLSTPQGIDLSGVEYPLNINTEGTEIQLMDESGKEIAHLRAGESVSLDAVKGKLLVSEINLPLVFSLEQNYPNPFNPSTTIEFSLPRDVSNARLIIYNALGQKVSEVLNTSLKAGVHIYTWNADSFASGIYYYHLTADNYVSTRKMMLLK